MKNNIDISRDIEIHIYVCIYAYTSSGGLRMCKISTR